MVRTCGRWVLLHRQMLLDWCAGQLRSAGPCPALLRLLPSPSGAGGAALSTLAAPSLEDDSSSRKATAQELARYAEGLMAAAGAAPAEYAALVHQATQEQLGRLAHARGTQPHAGGLPEPHHHTALHPSRALVLPGSPAPAGHQQPAAGAPASPPKPWNLAVPLQAGWQPRCRAGSSRC